jgi:hypothetical protein
VLLAAGLGLSVEAKAGGFEVWVIDQSNTTGLSYGGKLYVYEGSDLMGEDASSAAPIASIDLATLGGAGGLCTVATDTLGSGSGANPVRPHMIMFNSTHTHAWVSFVGSGHVAVFDAVNRTALACFRTHAGAGGVRQAHATFPSPDDSYALVANQNGRLLERIDTSYATNTFTHSAASILNLATCTTPNGNPCQGATTRPVGIPICPIIDSSSSLAFITLRDGGMFVVDPRTDPISILAEYTTSVVHGNGCGGVEAGGSVFINSGGPAVGTLANKSEFDVYRFPLSGYSASNPPNTPAPVIVFSDDSYVPPSGLCAGDPNCRDSHGMTATKHSRYLWVADRHRGLFEVFDVGNGAHVNTIGLANDQSADPGPDLADIDPQGNRIFVSLRGPNPLTGDPHVATGDFPGLGVIQVTQGGKGGVVKDMVRISNVDAGGVERADAHGLRVRLK